jgi:hypothetical protein
MVKTKTVFEIFKFNERKQNLVPRRGRWRDGGDKTPFCLVTFSSGQ